MLRPRVLLRRCRIICSRLESILTLGKQSSKKIGIFNELVASTSVRTKKTPSRMHFVTSDSPKPARGTDNCRRIVQTALSNDPFQGGTRDVLQARASSWAQKPSQPLSNRSRPTNEIRFCSLKEHNTICTQAVSTNNAP